MRLFPQPLLMILTYGLGVINERSYPGDRLLPEPGEWKIWVLLLGFLLMSHLVQRWERKFGRGK